MLKNINILAITIFITALFYNCDDKRGQEESTYYFPPNNTEEWTTILPDELGWDIDKLDETIQWVGDHKTVAFIILHKGKIVVEEHWAGWDIQKRIKIASITKSITAVLIGIAQNQELLKINDRVSEYLEDGWSNAPHIAESKITIKHLISMTSGLAESLSSSFEPGTNSLYSTSAFYQLWEIIEKASGQTFEAFADEALFKKIGMSKAIHWTKGGNMLPRDLSRFGLLMLSEGLWSEDDIFSNIDYFNDMLNPSQEFTNCYGYLWWLNNDCNENTESGEYILYPNAPLDMYAAMGAWDQRLYIIPSEDLVILRLGHDNQLPYTGKGSFNNGFWELMSQVLLYNN